ncbi:MAG: MlaD family protein [Pirellulales bacterium]
MDERTVQFRVGVMVLATILILAILLLLFGDLPSLVKGTYTVKFAFPQAPGVTQDTPVRVNGVLIGRVRHVELDEKVGVMITAKIEDKFHLFRDQVGRIGGSLLGDAVIEIVPSTIPRPHEKVEDGETLQGLVAKDPFQAITSLESNVSIALESIAKTSDEIGQLAQRVNRLVDSNEENIQRMIANTDATVQQLRITVANADALISDPVMRDNLKRTINELPKVLGDVSDTIAGVRQTMQSADRNLANLEGITKPLGERGPRLIENIDRAATQLDTMLTELSGFTRGLTSSQGTIAKLVNDPTLYDNVSQTVQNINQLSRELKPIMNDLRTFSDKAARHPEQFGVRGLIQGSSGIK